MNNDDDFGQYNCIAKNIHGRKEAIVFVLSMYSDSNEERNWNFYYCCYRRINGSFDVNNKKISSSSKKEIRFNSNISSINNDECI
jgi:hypothetical protein